MAESDVYRIARSLFLLEDVLHLLYECTWPNTRLKLTAPVVWRLDILYPITRPREKHEERCELPIHHQELGRETL